MSVLIATVFLSAVWLALGFFLGVLSGVWFSRSAGVSVSKVEWGSKSGSRVTDSGNPVVPCPRSGSISETMGVHHG